MTKGEKIQKLIDCKEEVDYFIHLRYHALAQKSGLTLEQYHLLVELDELALDFNDEIQGPTIGEIATSINNSQNTVSERVSRLESKGLVERKKDTQDRRISRIVLTEKGRKFINSIDVRANNDYLYQVINQLSEEQIEYSLNCIQIVLKQMKEDK